MTQGQPLRFALVGCGAIGVTHAEALAVLPPQEAVLTTCCDAVPECARAFAERFEIRAVTFSSILADPKIDAVTICTPSGAHAGPAVEALRSGKHVIIEKPMDVTLAACDALIAAQKGSGKTLAVISQHRFDPASIIVKEQIERGHLGRLFLADARIPWYREQSYYDSAGWRGTLALDGGGCLMNQGIHTLDLMLWFCGPVESIQAQMRTAAHERIDVEDVLTANLVFENGAIGTLLASTAIYPGFPARIAVHGVEGTAVIEGDRLHLLAIKGRDLAGAQSPALHAMQVATGGTKSATEQAVPLDAAAAASLAWGAAHRTQFADFIRCCRSGGKPLVDGVEGRNAVELILAAYESARTGTRVTL